MDKGAIGSRRALRLVRLVVAQHFTIMSGFMAEGR